MNNLHRVAPLLNQLDQIRLQLFRLVDHQVFTEDFDMEFKVIEGCTRELTDMIQVALNKLAIDRRVAQRPNFNEKRESDRFTKVY